jgi:hypothetical protein
MSANKPLVNASRLLDGNASRSQASGRLVPSNLRENGWEENRFAISQAPVESPAAAKTRDFSHTLHVSSHTHYIFEGT